MNITNLVGKGKSVESNKSVEIFNKKKCDKNDLMTLTTPEDIGESETVDNIGKMIAKCDYDSSLINNPRTKKQMQILLSRNGEGDKQLQKKSNLIEFAEIDEQSAIKISETALKNSGSSDEKYADRSRFEEIENKLEEMFAGIEDEHLSSIPAGKRSHEISLNINKAVNSSEKSSMVISSSNCYIRDVSASNKSLLPTKAAMKSTVSFSNNASTEKEERKRNSKSFQHVRTMPIRRKLSIEIDSGLLKFPTKNNEKINYEIQNVVGGDVGGHNGNASKKLCLQKSKVIKVEDCDTPKLKFKKSNRRGCVEYKPNKSISKQKQKKSDVVSTTKQKIKQRRLQRFLPSDNDDEFEEKTQHLRDMDNKNRSPFILVNSNGNVTVVNTLMQDESNEKYNKTKISKTYVFERKTVKGCHSSTLSNRYDADTADSSWICVFCKKGPHKKGLGDLFGPYIISTDCDEYQSNKDLIELYKKNGKTNLSLTEASSHETTLYNKKAKHLNDNSVKSHTGYHILDIPKQAENCSFSNYSLGMIKISECSYEIWIHEDCAIWAPNIYIIGSRLTGLEEATWNSTGHECCYCLKPGALLCCLQRDCKIMAHVPCARDVNWLLDETTFLTLCKEHFQAK